jgi:clan AA aspartic protease (TIGR02281 family)
VIDLLVHTGGPLLNYYAFTSVQHPKFPVSIWIPSGLGLTEKTTAEGIEFVTRNGNLSMLYSYFANTDISSYDGLIKQVTDGGFKINYSKLFKDEFFVISAKKPNVEEYIRFHRYAGGLIGFFLFWDPDDLSTRGDRIATIISAFLWSAITGAQFVVPFNIDVPGTTSESEAAATGKAVTEDEHRLPVNTDNPSTPAFAQGKLGLRTTEVRLGRDSGTFTVPVTINGALNLKFVLDSGASDVSIPNDVARTLYRTGTLVPEDFLDTQTYKLADGSTLPSRRFRIRSLKVGNVEIPNVIGSTSSTDGTLLLGQTFLKRFSSWSIDNERGLLILTSADPLATNKIPQAEANATLTDKAVPSAPIMSPSSVSPAPVVSASPTPVAAPIVSPSPAASPAPVVSASPAPVAAPIVSPSPAASPAPVVSASPAPVAAPIVSPSPAASPAPVVSASPTPVAAPIVGPSPAASPAPVAHSAPLVPLAVGSSELARVLQLELRRASCCSVEPNREWGSDSQEALALFNKKTGSNIDVRNRAYVPSKL